jgi:gas vesicle protein
MHIQSFIRGITIGFVLGILFAPASGTETRRKIAGKASDIKDKMKDTYGTVSDKVGQVKNKAGELFRKGKTEYNDSTSQGTNA